MDGIQIIRSPGNPLVRVSSDRVLAWLREMMKEAGFEGHALQAVQITVAQPFEGGSTFHHEVPDLIVMVSKQRVEGESK